MKNAKEFIDSGILELYVLGMASSEESKEVEEMAISSAVVRQEIDEISEALESNARLNAVEPDPVIRPFLMAVIDYTNRMQRGEQVSFPPMLHEGSRIADYTAWLNRSDMVLPEDFKDLFAKIIGYTPQATTAIVWIKDMAPQEVHDKEFERFLIVEGACTITIGENSHQLIPGDFLSIPLYKTHTVKVTSGIPCKIILQRVAA